MELITKFYANFEIYFLEVPWETAFGVISENYLYLYDLMKMYKGL